MKKYKWMVLLNLIGVIFSTFAMRDSFDEASIEENNKAVLKKKDLNQRLLNAAKSSDIESLNCLLQQGAYVNTMTEDGETVLMLVAKQEDVKAVQNLLSYYAYIPKDISCYSKEIQKIFKQAKQDDVEHARDFDFVERCVIM